MNYQTTDLFRILLFIYSVAIVSSTIQREKNVALNAKVREFGNPSTFDAIVDGNPDSCVKIDDGDGLHIQLNDSYVINKIRIVTGKRMLLSDADSIKVGRENQNSSMCALLDKSSILEVTCFQGQVIGSYLEVIHIFKRSRIWCDLQVIVCEDGYFGEDCLLDCHCDGGDVCDKMTGACLGGLCDAGWEGIDCQQACTNGRYGKNCVGLCHCEDVEECNIRNGSCSGCTQGWYGTTCQTEMAKIKKLSLYTETENSLEVSWLSWGEVMDEEVKLTFVVFYRRSTGADDDAVARAGHDNDDLKRKNKRNGSENEESPTMSSPSDEESDNIITDYLNKGWTRGPEVNHTAGRNNYFKTIDNLHHNTFYEFIVLPKLTTPELGVVYGEPSGQSQPFRTKCKAPGNPVMKDVTSIVDHSHSPSRASINVHWLKLSDYDSNCENILYYEIYYEDASKPMNDRQWLKKTVHPINEEVNITGVQFATDYRVKMCVLNNYHLETCCDPIRLKTQETPTPTFNHQSSGSIDHKVGIVVGVLFVVLATVVVVSVVFLRRQRYSRHHKSQSFFTRNDSQVGLASDLSHSSEHEDLLSQIIIHRSSLNNNNKHVGGENLYSANNNNSRKAKQQEQTTRISVSLTTKEMESLSRSINRDELVCYMEKMRRENYRNLKREYEEIPTENPDATKKVGQMSCNIMKNRFKDVIAYDHTRVVLKSEDDCLPNNDYINASYINGLNKQKVYIAAQGCKKNTVVDFWKMTWQQDSRRVVMVTNLIERSSMKCQQYWPNKIGLACRYGDIDVTLNDVIKTTHYTIRSLGVNKGGVTRDIKQFHFTAWPDQGVPSKINQMLTFRNKVRACDDTNPGIIIVHCSAGIGRTGAFIALDICMQQLDDESVVDVMKTTAMMRLQRCNLIQRVEQYIFVYQALAEYLKVGNTTVQSSKFNSYHQNLKKVIRSKDGVTTGEGQNMLQRQFELLDSLLSESSSSSPTNDEESISALSSQNKDKNRYSTVVPNDKTRPYLTSVIEGTNDYINAIHLDGYRSKNAYILTQMPLPSTVIDIWRLVFENDVRIIIMLNSFNPRKHQSYGQYWPDENEECECGPFFVQSMNVRTKGKVVVRELQLTCVAEVMMNSSAKSKFDPSPRNVILFQMNSLDHEYFLSNKMKPMNSSQLHELIQSASRDLSCLIELVEDESSKMDVDLSVVVHCDDGCTLSGLYVAISCIHQRLKDEGEVDVFQAVRNLKSLQGGIIPSLKQYQFCYEMASKFVNKS